MASPSVSFERKELTDIRPKYDVIKDCLNSDVKLKGDIYLPRPNASDLTPDNRFRYDAYLTRAVFYDVTSRTLGGLVGQIYSNDPEVKLPDSLKNVQKDANGDGLSLVQSSKETTRKAVSFGASSLYVDFPVTQGAVSKAQQDSGTVKPTINIYDRENVINWQTRRRGANHVYDLIVLVETETIAINDFEREDRTYYKALRLKSDSVDENGNSILGTYYIELYKSNSLNKTYTDQPTQVLYPQDANGNPLTEIPFTFVGSENNDALPDSPPLYPLAVLNIGHYRNSADYEEACFIVGQPTYVVNGLTEEWYEKVLQKKLPVGSRGGIPLPVGADAKILQVDPNSMAKEAMEHKEKQMVAIGARLVEANSVAQTATEANINNTAETSQLADLAKNVSAAYTWALKKCLLFIRGDEGSDDEVKFDLNTEFAINRMSSLERAELIAEWVQGAITFTEMRKGLRESGVAILADDEARKELDDDAAKKADQAAQSAKKMADAVPPVPIVAAPAKKPASGSPTK